MSDSYTFRFAAEQDIPEILRLIKELAEYEKATDEAVATAEILHDSLFKQKMAEALLVEHAHAGVVGCAIFFRNFSTWTGIGGMYLEDLYIMKEHRGSGIGRRLMAQLAQICQERGWVRLDWSCLDWNKPSLGFYKSIGADAMTEWVHHRLSGASLNSLAGEAE